MTPLDKKIILFVIAVALLMGAWVAYRHFAVGPGGLAIIEVNNREVQRVQLRPGETARRFTVRGTRGELLIEVDGESIRVVEADCPDKVCIGMGRKSRPGEVIVCLPNRVVIRVEESVRD
ncbi:MAG: hypothetical protein DDT39_01647 [Firmicutes bacterium]|nr:hypothetical protein [candidate division NPL-UPA2 bacterium]